MLFSILTSQDNFVTLYKFTPVMWVEICFSLCMNQKLDAWSVWLNINTVVSSQSVDNVSSFFSCFKLKFYPCPTNCPFKGTIVIWGFKSRKALRSLAQHLFEPWANLLMVPSKSQQLLAKSSSFWSYLWIWAIFYLLKSVMSFWTQYL